MRSIVEAVKVGIREEWTLESMGLSEYSLDKSRGRLRVPITAE